MTTADDSSNTGSAEGRSSAPGIIHQTALMWYPNKTIRGTTPCLLRWHDDDTIDAVTLPEQPDELEVTIFTCKPSDLTRVSPAADQSRWCFYLADKRYKIGLSPKQARKRGYAAGGAAGGGAIGGAIGGLAMSIGRGSGKSSGLAAEAKNAKKLDPWWKQQLKESGVKYGTNFLFLIGKTKG